MFGVHRYLEPVCKRKTIKPIIRQLRVTPRSPKRQKHPGGSPNPFQYPTLNSYTHSEQPKTDAMFLIHCSSLSYIVNYLRQLRDRVSLQYDPSTLTCHIQSNLILLNLRRVNISLSNNLEDERFIYLFAMW